jgi:hypothetical protein
MIPSRIFTNLILLIVIAGSSAIAHGGVIGVGFEEMSGIRAVDLDADAVIEQLLPVDSGMTVAPPSSGVQVCHGLVQNVYLDVQVPISFYRFSYSCESGHDFMQELLKPS